MVACGGARETDLFGRPPVADDASIDTFVPDEDAAEPPPDDATTPDDVVVVPDAGKPDVVQPYKDPGIQCGATYCTPAAQYCCNDKDLSQNPQWTCQATGTIAGCVLGVKVSCDGKADCPSTQVCCGGLMNGAYDEVSCKTTCSGIVFGRNQIRFCDPKAPVDECKAIGLTCKPSGALKPYSVCQ